MGIYLNPGAARFAKSRNSAIYVDKSNLIAYTNSVVNTEQQYVCVSRPRRFGKSMAANMLAEYYDRTGNAAEQFAGLQIATDPSFAQHANKYDVIRVDMQDFFGKDKTQESSITELSTMLIRDLMRIYPDIDYIDKTTLWRVLGDIYQHTSRPFVVIIDEWDCPFRALNDHEDREPYILFLRNLLKDKPYVALAYMTGILPIKKYGTHSVLNMFEEITMLDPGLVARPPWASPNRRCRLCARNMA